jgi:protein-tyrosine phosphatase
MARKLEPTRYLDLEGTYNVRDLGGYETLDGRRTRWRTFVRADSLHRLSPKSAAMLVEYGVRTVIDLRRTVETEQQPSVFREMPEAVRYYHHNMVGDSFSDPGIGFEPPTSTFTQYKAILDGRADQIGETMATLAEPGTSPALFHCVGGQDRTGLIAALLLGIAGAPPEIIAKDYSLTAHYIVNLYLGKDAPPGVDPARYTREAYQRRNCPPEAMLLTLEHLAMHYGGVEGYLRAAGLSAGQIGNLRDAFVE